MILRLFLVSSQDGRTGGGHRRKGKGRRGGGGGGGRGERGRGVMNIRNAPVMLRDGDIVGVKVSAFSHAD